MIELRWIVRNTGVVFRGVNEAGEVDDFPQTEQVLQWRDPWSLNPDRTDWQDVPLVRED
jgi:hypothetical protein